VILSPREAMALAIEEGRKGAGFVSPNPLVGCVILSRDFELLGKGHHARHGEAHAEINALNSVADKAHLEGAHVYVTLEPCAHEGRTGSCARHLATLPIASVVYGLEDPNPLVSGRGVEILRQAGITVEWFRDFQPELEELAEHFLLNQRLRRPFVALKVASSLDGLVALGDGSSQWITGEAARSHVQYLRGCYDAVVTGRGTLEKDNPRMNSRDQRFHSKRQRLVVLDPEGRVRFDGLRLLEVRSRGDIYWVTAPEASGEGNPGIAQLKIPLREGHFDISVLLSELMSAGLHSIFVEAGPFTASSFLAAGKVDRLFAFLAPKLVGRGLSWTSGLEIPSLEQALRLHSTRAQTFGEDLLVTGRLLWS
jgi:diaminohydroxyphosphoribosylaminopyrimidine deaminase/5-amino-6-(5-phosphoribosylamino)uracil reductase